MEGNLGLPSPCCEGQEDSQWPNNPIDGTSGCGRNGWQGFRQTQAQ